MNTIIVPTDFSPSAEKASLYATQLAKKVEASLLLVHMYQLPVPMTDYPLTMVSGEDIKKAVEERMHGVAEEAKKRTPDVPVETDCRLGDVVMEIAELCKERNPFAVVVGNNNETGFDRLLFGDTTLSLIKHCSSPVIAVPEPANAVLPANIALATDLLNPEEIPAAVISAIAKVLGANLHVVHVEKQESGRYPEELMNAFPDATYHPVKEEDVTEGLRQYVAQNNIDLVIVLPHKHNLYERIFFKEHTGGILHSMPVPVMSMRNE